MAGLPIGGNVGDCFYRLEVHYNNPNKSAGQSVVYNGKYHTLMNISVLDMIKQLFNLCAGRVDNSGDNSGAILPHIRAPSA